MLKRRIIPIQLLMNGRLVKSICFDNFRDVGDPVKSSAVYNSQYADELILLNISRQKDTVYPLVELIQKVSAECFMPLSVGGGVTSLEDATFLIQNGADKVILNSAAYRNHQLISKIADRFGAQAVVVAIDVKQSGGHYSVLSANASCIEGISLEEHIKKCEVAGAGEFLIQSVDRDGSMNGFDLDLLRLACSLVGVPVIGCGGSGNYSHLKEAFLETDVSALACGSLFNFSDSNPMRAKAFLSNYGLQFKIV
jgi:cyclase